MAENSSVFRDLDAGDVAQNVTEIESCCMNCFKNGTTRLLLTKIPFYKEVIIMSFNCDHCGCENNEIKPGGEVEPKGIKIKLTINTVKDLNRRIVKSDYTSVRIEELEFEIPSNSQKGEITTIEGVIDRSVAGLQQDQPTRKIEHPEVAAQIDQFIEKLNELKAVKKPFTITFEDISGNCRVENPNVPQADEHAIITHFTRTQEQNHELGVFTQSELAESTSSNTNEDHLLKPIPEGSWPLEELHNEVLQFATNCHNCKAACETNMKVTSIPHFKEVVIMATVCDNCGTRTNEVKSGGGIEKKGIKITVRIEKRDDMSRDVLKSDTCSLDIPELECEIGPSGLGGRFTTVEGILEAVKDQLTESSAIFHDSGDAATRSGVDKFVDNIQKIVNGELKVTLILDDPAGNSYVQTLTDDSSLDDRLTIERYVRSFEQNEELGLNHLKTENYEED